MALPYLAVRPPLASFPSPPLGLASAYSLKAYSYPFWPLLDPKDGGTLSLTLVPPGGWKLWSLWGECTRDCGGGLQTRTRTCLPTLGVEGGGCEGVLEEGRLCNRKACGRKWAGQGWG